MTDRLLILTNSVDGTSDVLVHLVNRQNASFLRWNVDLWRDYRIRSTPQSTEIIASQGRHVHLEDPRLQLLWRNPFVEQMDFHEESVAAADREVPAFKYTRRVNSGGECTDGQISVFLVSLSTSGLSQR
jgi:hypothetical protein